MLGLVAFRTYMVFAVLARASSKPRRCFLMVFVIPKSWVSDPGYHLVSTPTLTLRSLGLHLRSDLGGGCLTSTVALGLATYGSEYCCPDPVEGGRGGPDLRILPTTSFARKVDELLTTLSGVLGLDIASIVASITGRTSHDEAVSVAGDTANPEAALAIAVGSILDPLFRSLQTPATESMPEFRVAVGLVSTLSGVAKLILALFRAVSAALLACECSDPVSGDGGRSMSTGVIGKPTVGGHTASMEAAGDMGLLRAGSEIRVPDLVKVVGLGVNGDLMMVSLVGDGASVPEASRLDGIVAMILVLKPWCAGLVLR